MNICTKIIIITITNYHTNHNDNTIYYYVIVIIIYVINRQYTFDTYDPPLQPNLASRYAIPMDDTRNFPA